MSNHSKHPDKRVIVLASTCLVAVGLGYYLSRSNDTTPAPLTNKATQAQSPYSATDLPENRPMRQRMQSGDPVYPSDETPPHALKNERILMFSDEESYRKFLASLEGRGLKLLGQFDPLRSVRVALGAHANLDDIDGAEQGYNYSVSIPTPPQASAQEEALGFGMSALSWLGLEGDNSNWGDGVTVAVIDSGVNQHPALQGDVSQIELAALSDGSEQLGHGTAVASIISGDHRLTPGVAPASEILSIRVSDETGYSNSFSLAEGIVQAVDAGAEVINISMGSYGDSQMVYQAVQYAQENGAVIVASSGNEGLETLAYPAAYQEVISVGAVEQGGDHLDFSNSHNTLDITAPGYQVNAAWGDEQLTSFSGTSASAPFVSGAIAATMSEFPNLSAQQAADLVLGHTADAGLPNADPDFGSGILDLGQIMNHDTSGIYDAAVTGQVLVNPETPGGLPEVWVTIQNQGTETLINSPVSISSPSGEQNLNISSLAPGQTQTFQIPLNLPFNGEPATVTTQVQTSESDANASDNSRSDHFVREPTE